MMEGGFYFALGVAIILALLPFLTPVPKVVAWAGTLAGLAIMLAEFLPGEYRPTLAAVALFVIGVMALAGSGYLYFHKEKVASGHGAPSQPDILLLPPTYRYRFAWHASSNMEMVISPERPATEMSPLRTAIPVFHIKNIGNAIAKDVTIEWTINGLDLRKTFEDSARLKGLTAKLTGSKFLVFNRDVPEAEITNLMTGQGFGNYILD